MQEELEHYFLESRDLQAQLKRINARLLDLFKTFPASGTPIAQSSSNDRIEVLVQRQQNALRRFERLHAASCDA